MTNQNCRIKRGCTLVPAVPVQICKHWLSDGSVLMITLYYRIRNSSKLKNVRIDENLKNKFLELYNYREDSRKLETTWHIHDKK